MPTPCDSPPISDECKKLKNRIDSKQKEIERKQLELRTAAPSGKPLILQEIRELIGEKTALQLQYAECIKVKPVSLRFLGTMRVVFDDPGFAGLNQTAGGLNFVAHFTAERDHFTVYSMEDITSNAYTFDCLGQKITGVTVVHLKFAAIGNVLNGCNLYLRDTVFRFDHSVGIPVVDDQDSDLPITLSTTGLGGSAVDAAGNAALVGAGTFQEGYLNGKTCTMTLSGTFSSA